MDASVNAFAIVGTRTSHATTKPCRALSSSFPRETTMNLRVIIPSLAIAALLAGCETYGDDGPRYAGPGYGPRAVDEENWDAVHYYRDGDYQERVLTADDRVYYGRDGRYYCRRSDGTAGLIIGGIAGGVIGNAIAPGGSKTLGTILGAAGGAAIGDAVATSNTRCR
jgi:hypothetical protein